MTGWPVGLKVDGDMLVLLGNTQGISMAPSQTTSLKLESGLKERLKRLAAVRKRSAHWLMREAIEQYIAREEARERLKEDSLLAWAEYERTGRHVTAEEAGAWLERLELGEDAKPPVPHE